MLGGAFGGPLLLPFFFFFSRLHAFSFRQAVPPRRTAVPFFSNPPLFRCAGAFRFNFPFLKWRTFPTASGLFSFFLVTAPSLSPPRTFPLISTAVPFSRTLGTFLFRAPLPSPRTIEAFLLRVTPSLSRTLFLPSLRVAPLLLIV